MTSLLTNKIATVTELREPHKVIEKANGKPIAIMKNSKCVGYFVPEEATEMNTKRYATKDEFIAMFEATKAEAQPVLDYLKDK